MVKIFDCVDPWPTKVNFVDSNNVVLGYDMDQWCCEVAEWEMKPHLTEEQLELYTFDTSFFDRGNDDSGYYPKNWVKFKLVSHSNEMPDVYITLSNTHNGYYSRGFEFAGPTGPIERGDL